MRSWIITFVCSKVLSNLKQSWVSRAWAGLLLEVSSQAMTSAWLAQSMFKQAKLLLGSKPILCSAHFNINTICEWRFVRYTYLILIKCHAYRAKLSQSDTLCSLAHLQLWQSQIYICMKHMYVAYKLLNIEQERHFCMLRSMLQRYGTRVSSILEQVERAEHEQGFCSARSKHVRASKTSAWLARRACSARSQPCCKCQKVITRAN